MTKQTAARHSRLLLFLRTIVLYGLFACAAVWLAVLILAVGTLVLLDGATEKSLPRSLADEEEPEQVKRIEHHQTDLADPLVDSGIPDGDFPRVHDVVEPHVIDYDWVQDQPRDQERRRGEPKADIGQGVQRASESVVATFRHVQERVEHVVQRHYDDADPDVAVRVGRQDEHGGDDVVREHLEEVRPVLLAEQQHQARRVPGELGQVICPHLARTAIQRWGRVSLEVRCRQGAPARGPVPVGAAEEAVADEELDSEIHRLAPRGAEPLALPRPPPRVQVAANSERGRRRAAHGLDGLEVEEGHRGGQRHGKQSLWLSEGDFDGHEVSAHTSPLHDVEKLPDIREEARRGWDER
mmetsp:Transcript_5177/g.13890  ORF Transcript_5177/g.13890 Transcript_5177/m.13890 type:complete len:354 (-) Transcript_5177:93-1154(-)